MKKYILFLFLLAIGLTASSKVVTITNSGTKFTPSSITINFGDSVKFTIGTAHDAVEVSKSIWDVNEASPLSGGFKLPMGGGILIPEQLAIGTHYYVCTPHATLGMKGSIVVLGPSTLPVLSTASFSFFPNPARELIILQPATGFIGCDYQILDITGQLLETGKLENVEQSIDIRGLTTGTYFFRVISQKEEVFRFIKN